MCKDCGCSSANEEYFSKSHAHTHHHHQSEVHQGPHSRTIKMEEDVLKKNNELAHQNFHYFDDHKIRAVNLISSPGSGKTTLLEATLRHPKIKEKKVSILVGDQQTDHDAERLLNYGGDVKQINTHSSCHLDAQMIQRELGGFVSGEEDLLIIENIGNLVCPAAFDLGEQEKIAILSITEGEDKPIKYPVLFNQAKLVVITKMDLSPYLDYNLEKTKTYIRQVNPKAKIIEVSAKSGEGMDQWVSYLLENNDIWPLF